MSTDLNTIKSALSCAMTLSMHDFQCGNRNPVVSEYLSLAITRHDGYFCIRITTSDAQPITYTTVIPNMEEFDLEAVKFEMQAALWVE